ncbi:MAG: DUF3168 domain-containing protein [Rhizobiales bacterium]|nr:DUF3168 domain-containing protein [Hyphomicrobiales bacterium]
MSLDADLALQQAIFARLGADAGVSALVGTRLYDNAPGETGFPYVTLGESDMRDWNTGDSHGSEHRLTFYVWSRAGGRSEAKAILGAIRACLEEAALSLTDHDLVNLTFTGSDTRRAPDGATWRGAIRFRAVTERI